ncbi:MAG: DUF4255 domain-containing protein [Cyclobacteriaceae bacterium]
MDTTTLEEITRTIIEVLHNSLGASVEVTPVSIRDDKEGVGFYLFHVQENNHYKNYPSPGKDAPPVNYTPMALNLFYQLSAYSQEHERENIYNEQRWMSTAMKVLHDNSIIRKTISSPDFPEGKDIDIKITLQTMSPSESVQYWTATQSPVRLSAYYEVSVVFLEPEKPIKKAGRVLNYGTFIFTQGTPRIIGSRNHIQLTIPGDPNRREITLEPAQVSPGNDIEFFGTGFAGDKTELLINSKNWAVPALASTGWAVNIGSSDLLSATVQEKAHLKLLGFSSGDPIRTFNFTITQGGTIGSALIVISWTTNSGTSGMINLPITYIAGTSIDIADGLRLVFSDGTLTAGQSFSTTVEASGIGPIVLPAGSIGTATITSPGMEVDLLPGIYGAQINVVRSIKIHDSTKEIQNISNQFPFTVTPKIISIGTGAPPDGNLWTIGSEANINGYIFRDPLKPGKDLDVQVYVAGQILTKVEGTSALQMNQFRIISSSELEVKLPVGLTRVPFQIMVSGAESPPEWITVV